MFKLIPGVLEFGTIDNLLHLSIGAIFLLAGIMTRDTIANYIEPNLDD
jgi:hypothetical protein